MPGKMRKEKYQRGGGIGVCQSWKRCKKGRGRNGARLGPGERVRSWGRDQGRRRGEDARQGGGGAR